MPKTSPRKLSVSFDLLSGTTRDDVDLRRLRKGRLFSYQRGNGLIDTAHQFTRVPPAV